MHHHRVNNNDDSSVDGFFLAEKRQFSSYLLLLLLLITSNCKLWFKPKEGRRQLVDFAQTGGVFSLKNTGHGKVV